MVIGDALHNLGFVALYRGYDAQATAYFVESLESYRRANDHTDMPVSLAGLAAVAAARGQLERAARLFGAAEALLEATSERLDPADRIACDRSCAAVRNQLDAVTFAAAWAEGRTMEMEQAIAYALETAGATIDGTAGAA